MDAILRALTVYIFLLTVFRLSGKRTLAQITTFDFVLLLIVGEATQQALLGEDYSLTNAAIIISSLVGFDVMVSLIKRQIPSLSRWLDGTPLVIFKDGNLIKERAGKERLEESDVLEAARSSHGLKSLDEIDYVVLEKNGSLSVVPKSKE